MKKRVVLLLTSLFLWVSSIFAQDVPVGVDLIIHNRTTNADKRTAERAMANFFAENKVSSFNVNHEGKRDESSFIIGTLGTANGNFRVNCFFRKVQNKYVIHQIRIDKANE